MSNLFDNVLSVCNIYQYQEEVATDGAKVEGIQPILANVDSGSTGGETSLIAVNNPVGRVPNKVDDASNHILKKAPKP